MQVKHRYGFSLFCLLLIFLRSTGQPYVNLVDARFLYSPDKGLIKQSDPSIKMKYFNVGASLPIQFKKTDGAIIFSPVYEKWDVKMTYDTKVRGIILPVIFLKNFAKAKFSAMLSVITRWNKEVDKDVGNCQQWGGLVMFAIPKNKNLTFKLGLYYNRELSGNFFVPLLGIDWKMPHKNNLFGVLPGNLTFEHKVNPSFYYGATFRAITNSYRLYDPDPCASGNCDAKKYLRINDNQLGFFADYYLTKKIVLNAEAGHTFFRKIVMGWKAPHSGPVKTVLTQKDNFFVKVSLAYRLRFR